MCYFPFYHFIIFITLSTLVASVVVVVVSIAFATSVSDEVEVVDVGKATASSHAQCSGEFHLSMDYCFVLMYRIRANATPLLNRTSPPSKTDTTPVKNQF